MFYRISLRFQKRHSSKEIHPLPPGQGKEDAEEQVTRNTTLFLALDFLFSYGYQTGKNLRVSYRHIGQHFTIDFNP